VKESSIQDTIDKVELIKVGEVVKSEKLELVKVIDDTLEESKNQELDTLKLVKN
jgi:hypothetical protein